MRTETTYAKELALIGNESLAPVSGRQIELLGEFTVASGTCGFRFLKSGDKQASLTYDTDKCTLTLDLTTLDREVNDANPYAGIYTATLPRKVATGEKLKLHVFLDGSIADIFVCDTWAFSVRLFPRDASAIEAEAFATTEMQASLKAWTLDADNATAIAKPQLANCQLSTVNCQFDLLGRRLTAPQKGICIKDGRKYVCR